MKKTIATYALRFVLITLALTVLAPVLPGVEFDGSILSRIILGAGLVVTFTAMIKISKKAFCVPDEACPHPNIVQRLIFIQVITSIGYVALVGMLLPTALSVSGVIPLAITGLLALLGAVLSGVAERLFKLS